MMMGPSELMIILMMMMGGGGMGIPLSVPPAEPDPLLDVLSPPEALFYSQWSGVAEADGDSENATERLLAEPEVQQFIARLESLGQMLAAQGRQQGGEAAMAATMVPVIAKTMLTRPLMMYVSDVEVAENPRPRAAMVVNLGPEQNDVARLLQLVPAQATQDVEIAGATFRRFQPGPNAPQITFGIRGKYLLIGVGDNEVERLLERAGGEAPPWLSELRGRFPVKRISTISYWNLGTAIEKFAPLAGGPPVMRLLEQSGLKGASRHVSVSGLDERGFAQFSAVDFDGPLQGLLSAAPSTPLTAADLAPIPREVLVGAAMRFDLGKQVEAIVELLGSVDPNAVQQFEDSLAQVEQELGMRVRQDLLASLGDAWTIHTAAEDGGLISGWTATVQLKDRAKLNQFAQRVKQLAGQAADGPRAPKIDWNSYQGNEIYTLVVPAPEFTFAPSWCITEDRLVVAAFPQAIRSYLMRQAGDGETMADIPQVAEVLKGDAISISVADHKRMIELFYPMAQIGMQMAAGAARQEGVPLDAGMLPALTSIAPHLELGVTATRRTENGFLVEKHQTLPGGSAAAAAPITIALLLPAVQQARHAARVAQTLNDMKQIALGVHNFHDVYRTFPPRYNTDKDGKPLLSWRVYLLPFIEQAALFEQFHLDEPWDSEHNKKLIPLMPDAYRSSLSSAPVGKTVYVAPASKDSMFQPPEGNARGEKMPRTMSFADVTDGTSNTAMIVVVQDKHAVTWTKPDDYEYQEENPAAGLLELQGQYLIGMGDGSVQRLQLMAKEVLAVFTRNGREVIDFRR